MGLLRGSGGWGLSLQQAGGSGRAGGHCVSAGGASITMRGGVASVGETAGPAAAHFICRSAEQAWRRCCSV